MLWIRCGLAFSFGALRRLCDFSMKDYCGLQINNYLCYTNLSLTHINHIVLQL